MAGRSFKGKFLRMVQPGYSPSGRGLRAGTIPMMLAVFTWLFLCVWLSSQAVKFNYEINAAEKTRERLKTTNRTLEIKLQAMMSSEGIARAAKERYGFKIPSDGQVQMVGRKKTLSETVFEILRKMSGRRHKR